MSSRASAWSKRGALSADSHGCSTATRPSTARSRWNHACHASIAGSTSSRKAAVRVGLVQDAYGGGEHRRLGDAARRDVGRAVALARRPELRAGAVIDRLRMEDDVRHHPVGPLPLEKGAHLEPAALGIDRREPDRDKGRVPVPLERVEPLRGLDEAPVSFARKTATAPSASAAAMHRHSAAPAGATRVVVRDVPHRLRVDGLDDGAAGARVPWLRGRRRHALRSPRAPPGRVRPVRREHCAPGHADRMVGREAAGGEDVDRRAEAPGEEQLRQCVEVDDVRAADEDEHRIGADPLEQLSREKGLVLARRRSEDEDHAAGLEQPLETRRLDPLLAEVRVREPGVVRAELAAEGLDQRP